MKLEADIICPSCKKKLKVKVADMRSGRITSCPSCRAEISFTGDDGRKAQRAIEDLERSLKKMYQ